MPRYLQVSDGYIFIGRGYTACPGCGSTWIGLEPIEERMLRGLMFCTGCRRRFRIIYEHCVPIEPQWEGMDA